MTCRHPDCIRPALDGKVYCSRHLHGNKLTFKDVQRRVTRFLDWIIMPVYQ